MSLCPESDDRSQMSDAEFWEHVYRPSWETNPRLDHNAFGPDQDEFELTYNMNQSCPECGQLGPCGYDSDMRPYLHIIKEDG